MANVGTPAPCGYQTLFDTNGNPISGGLIWSYIAGTTTPLSTYTTSALSVANTNPIVADSAGRWVAFLTPGSSYKFVYEAAATPPAHGTVIRTVDNVYAVPGSSGNFDVTGTTGEAITLGQAAYLSDGSGSKTAGLWYKADSANTYSSAAAVNVGIAVAGVASGASGTFRALGSVTGLTVVAGSTYYVGSAGAITTTQPANARVLGIADTSSSLVMSELTVGGGTIINPELRGQKGTKVPVTIASGSVSCDMNAGNLFEFTVSANWSLTTPNVVGSGKYFEFYLVTIGNGTDYTDGFPAAKWPGGVTPTVTVTSGKRDFFRLIYDPGVSGWYGFVLGQNL